MKGFFAHRIWVIAPPYLWMLVFFALPFGYILKISLAESVIAMPPYSDIWSWTEGQLSWLGSLDNYRFLLEDDLYYLAYFNSVRLAAIATLLCFVRRLSHGVCYRENARALQQLVPATGDPAILDFIFDSYLCLDWFVKKQRSD